MIKTLKYGLLGSLALLLGSCGGGTCNSCNGGGQPPVPPGPVAVDFQIDYVGVIPAVNGNATTSHFYVHNDGDVALSGITYTLAGAVGSSSGSSKKLARPKAAGDVIDGRGFVLNGASLSACSTIAPHSSCSVEFTTPGMTIGDQNNSLVIINVPDANGFNHQFDQVLNYSYYSASVLSGVDFAGAANVVSNLGTRRYMMGYLVGGSAESVTYDNVNLQFSLDGILSVNQGFVNGQQIGMNEVVPVEFVAQLSSTSNLTPLAIVPQYETNPLSQLRMKKLKADTTSTGQGLFVNTSTNVDSGLGVKIGLIPPLKAGIPVTIYVSSFGNVGALAIDPDNDNIAVSNNTCTSGIASNVSCSFVLTAEVDAIGQTIINFSLPDSGEQIISEEVDFGPAVLPEDTAWLLSNNPVTLLGLISNQQVSPINYIFSNAGNTDLTNLTFTPVVSGGATFRIIQNNCGSTLAVGSQCVVQVEMLAGSGSASGEAYLQASAVTGGGNPYTVNSGIINYAVTSAPGLYFSAPVGATATLVVAGDNRESQSAQFVLTNAGSSSQTINSVTLAGISVPSSLQIESNGCIGALGANQSCNIIVKYGPMFLESNVNGIANLVVSYGDSLTLQGTVNYTGVGMDSSLAVTNVVASGFVNGDGASATPYFARGCENTTPTLTITYTNLSVNYVAQNLSLDTIDGNISPYMNVESSQTTCGYGSNPKNLGIGQSCNLVLVTNKPMMNDASQYNLNVIYPSASWQTTRGYLEQDNFIYNGSNTVYADYIQPVLTSNVTPLTGSARNRTLTQSLVNAEGCGDIPSKISSLYVFGVTESPVIAGGNCTVNQDFSVSCINSASAANNEIHYRLPDTLPEDVNMFFVFEATNGTQMWFNPALLIFSVESSMP